LSTQGYSMAWAAGAGRHTAKRRLALPLLLSCVLHLLVLSQFSWQGLHAAPKQPQSLTVSLLQAPPPEERKSQSVTRGKTAQAQQNIQALEAETGEYHLDMNQIHGLVREYAKQEFATVKPSVPIEGDYFGTYTGRDSGIFFFHLDRNGHAVGNGQSDSFGIAFLIEGDVLPNGEIRAVGAKYMGESKFTGKLSGNLDRRTGKISGTWIVNKSLQGSFSGQREMQVSMN
jgi:hypothetical protein